MPGVSGEESRALAAEVRRCYEAANPDKVISGEVDALLAKYAGQETLLLRRVRFRYGLVSLRGTLARKTPDGTWADAEVAVRADGVLRWAEAGVCGGDVDVRRGAAAASRDRPGAFTVRDGSGGPPLLLAAPDAAARDAWVAEIADTAAFFSRLDAERACQREEASLVIAAIDASAGTLSAERERDSECDAREAADAERALAASRSDHRGVCGGEDALALARATLEGALDDALRHATDAADLEKRASLRDAHAAYRKAVAAFVAAKVAIRDMPDAARPERDVLDLIESGAAQCRAAADACRDRGAARRAPAQTPGDDDDARARPPAAISKLVLDSDAV